MLSKRDYWPFGSFWIKRTFLMNAYRLKLGRKSKVKRKEKGLKENTLTRLSFSHKFFLPFLSLGKGSYANFSTCERLKFKFPLALRLTVLLQRNFSFFIYFFFWLFFFFCLFSFPALWIVNVDLSCLSSWRYSNKSIISVGDDGWGTSKKDL